MENRCHGVKFSVAQCISVDLLSNGDSAFLMAINLNAM
jgi:hypothetical protein